MLNSPIILVTIASILGFLSGIGVGGGSLLILWLTMVAKVAYPDARITNLLFFIPAALVATICNWKKGALDWRKTLPAIIAGSIAAACSSLLSAELNTDIIKKAFGVLLSIAGVKEVFYRERKAK